MRARNTGILTEETSRSRLQTDLTRNSEQASPAEGHAAVDTLAQAAAVLSKAKPLCRQQDDTCCTMVRRWTRLEAYALCKQSGPSRRAQSLIGERTPH